MKHYFFKSITFLLCAILFIVSCEETSHMLAPDREQSFKPFAKKTADGKNLLLNPEFSLPAPNVSMHRVAEGSACGDLGYAGLYWSEWLPGASFTGIGNENLFGLMTCEGVPWLSYGDPLAIPGWMFTNGDEDALTYRSYFDYYTPSNQIVDLGKGNRLWQEIDITKGAVVYHIEYAWAATFASAGEAIVTFNENTLATHSAADYECSSSDTDLSNCYGNYNQWADDWDFGADPQGNGHGMQIEEKTVIVPPGNPIVTIAFEGTDGWFFPWAAYLGYFGIILDRVSVSAPDKIQICHRMGNNGEWHTIEIDNNQSVLAHMDHGDHIYSSGSCYVMH